MNNETPKTNYKRFYESTLRLRDFLPQRQLILCQLEFNKAKDKNGFEEAVFQIAENMEGNTFKDLFGNLNLFGKDLENLTENVEMAISGEFSQPTAKIEFF